MDRESGITGVRYYWGNEGIWIFACI